MDTKREDRLCQVCHSSRDVEDEQHFLFSCPAYSDVGQKHASLFQQAFTVSDFFTKREFPLSLTLPSGYEDSELCLPLSGL